MNQRDRLADILLSIHKDNCIDSCTSKPDRFHEHADALIARGVRFVDDSIRFDQDVQDSEAEKRFLQPMNPDPLTVFAKETRRTR